jgi:hypothetical protein
LPTVEALAEGCRVAEGCNGHVNHEGQENSGVEGSGCRVAPASEGYKPPPPPSPDDDDWGDTKTPFGTGGDAA